MQASSIVRVYTILIAIALIPRFYAWSFTGSTWVTLWLVTLVNHNVTSIQNGKKKSCKREREKTLVTLWLANVTNVTQVFSGLLLMALSCFAAY